MHNHHTHNHPNISSVIHLNIGPHTVSYANEWKIGTCGRPMYGTESMLVKENGELCYRGRHIFMGYMYMDKQTADTIDSEGYLHSGDVAEFDADVKSIANKDKEDMVGPSGFMKITGRIKELIITAGGENIPPVLIENEMKKNMLAVSNCMVVGEKRKYVYQWIFERFYLYSKTIIFNAEWFM